MLYFIYALVIVVSTSLGAVAGLGGGVIIKPLLDLVGAHDAAAINIYSSVAVFVMCCVSLTKQLRAGFQFDKQMVFSVAAGSLLGGVAGDKVFSALTGSFDNHLVKAVQGGILAVVLGLIFIYTLKQDQMPSWEAHQPRHHLCCGLCARCGRGVPRNRWGTAQRGGTQPPLLAWCQGRRSLQPGHHLLQPAFETGALCYEWRTLGG